MKASSRDLLINHARADLLTRPGEAFNDPARVQRLADHIAALSAALEEAGPVVCSGCRHEPDDD